MPIQTRSSRKKEAKGKGQFFTYQDNPFYMKDPLTDMSSSSGGPIFDEPKSPTIHEIEYNDGNKTAVIFPKIIMTPHHQVRLTKTLNLQKKKSLTVKKTKTLEK